MEFSFEDVAVKAKPVVVAEDQVEKDLERALSQYRQGNGRAALMCAADAVNRIAKKHDVNGGAWY